MAANIGIWHSGYRVTLAYEYLFWISSFSPGVGWVVEALRAGVRVELKSFLGWAQSVFTGHHPRVALEVLKLSDANNSRCTTSTEYLQQHSTSSVDGIIHCCCRTGYTWYLLIVYLFYKQSECD